MERRLSTTGYAVLGLLSFTRMSGYDLAGTAQRSVAQVWPISKTQAYAELRRLAEAGLVEGRGAARSGGPAKTIYELTAAGEAALDAWLESDQAAAPLRLRAPALLKLLVAHRVAPARTREQLGAFRAGVEERRAELDALAARMESQPNAVYAWATVLFGVRMCDAIGGLLDEVEPRLPARRVRLDPRRGDPAKALALLRR